MSLLTGINLSLTPAETAGICALRAALGGQISAEEQGYLEDIGFAFEGNLSETGKQEAAFWGNFFFPPYTGGTR